MATMDAATWEQITAGASASLGISVHLWPQPQDGETKEQYVERLHTLGERPNNAIPTGFGSTYLVYARDIYDAFRSWQAQGGTSAPPAGSTGDSGTPAAKTGQTIATTTDQVTATLMANQSLFGINLPLAAWLGIGYVGMRLLGGRR